MTVFNKSLEEARLHIETEMVKRNGGSDPPGDRLDNVTDMIIILVEKYRRMTRLLLAAVAMLLVGTTGMGVILAMNLGMQKNMERMQIDQDTLIAQQRETRKAISETKDKLDKTTLQVTETKEAVEKAVSPPEPLPPKKKR